MAIILRPHQQAAYDKWIESGTEGIVKAITGTGKTHIALKAIETNPDSVWIVVPTIPLQEQWEQMIKTLNVPYSLLGGGSNEICDGVVIAVDKSFQSYIKSHGSLNVRLLVLDEIHRMCSPENYDVLSKVNYTSVLGLSATPEREDNVNWLHMVEKIPIVYEHTLEDAQEQGTICEFDSIAIPCELSESEMIAYKQESAIIARIMPMYGYSIQVAMSAIKRGGQGEAVNLARAIQARKKIIADSTAKILKSVEILSMLNTKVIVFAESIDSIQWIYNKLPQGRPKFLYHSKVPKKDRKSIISAFKLTTNGVLLSARALDEGIDLPDVDTAVVVSGSSSQRQFIQRLGRILRPGLNKKAKLYEFYVKGSIDEKWMKKRKMKQKL